VELVTDLDQASISLVQRYMKIGYNRAARLIEHMEAEGIVGPSDGVKPRKSAGQKDPQVKNRKVHVVSLGCPKNQVDAEVMAAILQKHDFDITREPGIADIIIVNTCAFILPAKEEAIDAILRMSRWKKAGMCSHLVVTGCLSQRYGKTLEKTIPEVDLFLGIAEIPNIANHLERLEGGPHPSRRSVVGKPDFLMNANHPRLLSTAPSTAYLKIADGCSNRCSYCVIPTIRGKTRSRSLEDVLQEAQYLAKRGVKEIILTAQDTTAYGKDLEEKQSLGHLLKRLSTIKRYNGSGCSIPIRSA